MTWLLVIVATAVALSALALWAVKLLARGGPPDRSQGETLGESVQFTVYRPGILTPLKWSTMLAFAHLADRPAYTPQGPPRPPAQVEELAKKLLAGDGETYGHSTVDARASLPRESVITFEPYFEGFEFDPPRRSVVWQGETDITQFRMRPPISADGKVIRGTMRVFRGVVLLAEIDLSLAVDSAKAAAHSSPRRNEADTVSAYRKIFVSYSREDKKIVRQIVRIARASGDEFLMDVTHLRSGEIWDDRLKELIREADIFQLFWSSNSMYSTFVKDEWEYALSLNRRNFIRPTFWEEPMPRAPEKGLPPDALSRLEFYQIPLADTGQFFNVQGIGQQAATVVTVFLAGLCLALTLYFLMSAAPDQRPADNGNSNVNVNANAGGNTNAGANTNAGGNMNAGAINSNANANANRTNTNRNGNTTGVGPGEGGGLGPGRGGNINGGGSGSELPPATNRSRNSNNRNG